MQTRENRAAGQTPLRTINEAIRKITLAVALTLGLIAGVGSIPSLVPNASAELVIDDKTSLSMYRGVTKAGLAAFNSSGLVPYGDQGNPNPDWKGAYFKPFKNEAAQYATPSEEELKEMETKGKFPKTAGAVLEFNRTGKIRFITVPSEMVADDKGLSKIKTELGLDQSRPLVEQLGDEANLKRWGATEAYLAIRNPNGGYEEFIAPWKTVEKWQGKVVHDFTSKGGYDEWERVVNSC